MPIPQSQATRRIIEQFQTGKINQLIRAGRSQPFGVPPTNGNFQDIQAFEEKINASDYPNELRVEYYAAKGKNDYSFFNAKVAEYNQKQQAQIEQFEQNINSPDYPESLRNAYQEAKQKGDFTSFNTAISKYNTEQQAKLADFEQKVQAADYPAELRKAYYDSKANNDFSTFNSAVATYNAERQTEFQSFQERQAAGAIAGQRQQAQQRSQAIQDIAQTYEVPVEEINRIVKLLETDPNNRELADNPTKIQAVQDVINQVPGVSGTNTQKFLNKVYETVGTDTKKPEYVLKTDYTQIKAESPGLADTLKHKGVKAYEQDSGNYIERQNADTAVFFKTQEEYEKAVDEYNASMDNLRKEVFDKNYPAELRKEFIKSIKTGDVKTFNDAVNTYNAEQNKKYSPLIDFYYKIGGDLNELIRAQGSSQYASKFINESYDRALKDIVPYGSVDRAQFVSVRNPKDVERLLSEQKYDVKKYIFEHPNETSIRYLKTLQFPQSVIDDAQKYVDGIKETIKEINVDPKTWDDKFSRNSVLQIQANALGLIKRGVPGVMLPGDKLASGVYYKGGAIVADFDKFWASLSMEEKGQLVGAINSDPNKDNDFAALMERINTNYDRLPEKLQFAAVLTPYVGMPFLAAKSIGTTIAKRLTSQDVTPMEYALDAATAIFASLPYIGGVLEKGSTVLASKFVGKNAGKYVGAAAGQVEQKALMGGATGVIIKNFADTWKSMTPSERIANIGMLSLPFVGGGIRKAQFLKTITRRDYEPLRSMSMEAQTSRVPFNEKQLAAMRKAGITEADIIKAGDNINEQLESGKKYATVELGTIKIRVRNVPYQRLIGKSIFQGTPDVTQIGRGGSVPLYRDFYAAAKVALEPMQRSYLAGQRAIHPGIIEIRIEDPALLKKIGAQQRLISGGKTLEPEIVIPNLDKFAGKGYRLEPIPGPVGRGYTFDESLGELQIRRFTLSKVIGDETGLIRIKTGGTGDGGTVGVGDLHATDKFQSVFNDINTGYEKPVIEGNPNKPDTWQLTKNTKDRVLIFLGDSIDRGSQYQTWRRTLNRLQNEASSSNKVVRLLGNHELAYISGDAISGIKYTDAKRALIKQGIVEDILQGKVKAAIASEGKLYTHAGVSKGVFPEFKGKSPEFIADTLNKRLLDAVKKDNYDNKMFAKGRVEKGNSLSQNERSQGGPFWLRPQEATPQQLDLGFPQIVGHNPGFAVRRIWGDNFIETDVGRRSGGQGIYVDTPYIKTLPAKILVEPIEGKVPELANAVNNQLKITAMRDTIADVFLGWDGRIQAVKNLVNNREQFNKMMKAIDKQIAERQKVGDSYGANYLERTKEDLINPTAKDYLYGGMGFWRDMVMGRQNSVKISDKITSANKAQLNQAVKLINNTRQKINNMPSDDARTVFGMNKTDIISNLDVSNQAPENIKYKLEKMREAIDEALERNALPLLDRERIRNDYSKKMEERYKELFNDKNKDRVVYDIVSGRIAEYRAPRLKTKYRIQTRTTSQENRQPGRYPLKATEERSGIGSLGRTPNGIPPQRIPPIEPPQRTPPYPPRTPPPIPPENPPYPPKPPLRKGGTDQQNRRIIANAGGAIAINTGEVGAPDKRKRVWDVVTRDYSGNANYLQVLGDAPKGATILRKGKGSAYATAQMLTGEPPKKPVTIDKGMMDIELSAEGRNITAHFKPDPKGLTRGDIQAGEHKVKPISDYYEPISERSPRLSRKVPRISSPAPRISSRSPRLR